MTLHYLKIALRNMRRFKLQTIVCLTGLAVGMTCFALGTLWLRYIESFEDFVPDRDDIYFVTCGVDKFRGGTQYTGNFSDGRALMENRPEVAEFCTIGIKRQETVLDVSGEELEDGLQTIAADTTFVRWWGIRPVKGSLDHINHGEIVLTQSAAQRIFGGDEALGQQVTFKGYDENQSYTVVAVVPDCPRNTQFDFEAIVPLDSRTTDDGYISFQSFVKLHRNAPTDSIVGRTVSVTTVREDTYGGLYDPLFTREFLIVPLRDLRSDYVTSEVLINTSYVRWFTTLGLLVIACSLFNYVITMVSHLRRRGWEMSLRRVLGASMRSILFMVGLETAILFLLAAALAALLTWLVLPAFLEYSGIDIAWNAMAQRLAAYLALVIACGMACSSLTAWIVMRRTQRGILFSRQLSHSSAVLDRVGVTLQMALSIGIIFAVTIMLRQVRFMMYSDELGFTHNDMGLVYTPDEEMRQRISQSPLVEETLNDVAPIFPVTMRTGQTLSSDSIKREGDIRVDCRNIDSLTYQFFHLTLVSGRLPRAIEHGGTIIEACVNESFCHTYGFTPQTVIGQIFFSPAWKYEITGVLRNTYTLGPTIQPDPQISYHPGTAKNNHTALHSTNIIFRTRPGRLKELCDSLTNFVTETEDMKMMPVNIEEEYNKYVQSEQMLIKILLAVGGASLFVCVIGTFSLVSLSLQQRRKEIAIRKVHGARMKDILRLFLKGQVVSLGVAAIIAYPLAFIIMKYWLEGYAKQVGIDWWLIPATFLVIAAVVLATITLKIWRAAKESTVEALNS